jgi:enoyl-CoA hydratase/carnithine racemase
VSERAGGRLRLDFPADHVARLTIDNPAKRNALDRELLDALAAALGDVEARCLLLTGAGPMFSAGYDIGDLPADEPPGAAASPVAEPPDAAPPPAGEPPGAAPSPADGLAAEAEEVVAHPFEAALAALDAFPMPVVAALNGHAIGGGLELALACDLRVAAASAKLGMPPARLGLVYSHSGLRRFVDAIGAPRTRELFFTARNVDAATALQWGMVNRVVEDDELAAAGVELAAAIAGNAPLSLRGNKRVIRALLADQGALEPAVESELVALREACFRSEDFREGVRAFAEKRQPRWQGR